MRSWNKELQPFVPPYEGPKMRVVVGLSGGVDSAVAAWVLQQQGHEVLAIFMKNWDDDAYCTSRADFLSAASVAEVLGLEIEHINFAAEYRQRVFAAFLSEYQAGRTPNPDVLCNAEIKFRAFLDHAMARGAAKIATGHYAQVRLNRATQQHELLRGSDSRKDQSYFLYRLTQAQLAKTLFPIGHLEKSRVRRMAAAIGLPNASRKDSTGICFIGERPFREFLGQYIAQAPGPIRRSDGRVLGQHRGLSFYTLGQRQGLGIGGVQDASTTKGVHRPWFVAHKAIAQNTLWVVPGQQHSWLWSDRLQVGQMSWIAGQAPQACPSSQAAPVAAPQRLYGAKTRYRQSDSPCRLVALGPAAELPTGVDFVLQFSEPQWAVTPGQSVVLYDGPRCLGGGVIDASNTVIDLPQVLPDAAPARRRRAGAQGG